MAVEKDNEDKWNYQHYEKIETCTDPCGPNRYDEAASAAADDDLYTLRNAKTREWPQGKYNVRTKPSMVLLNSDKQMLSSNITSKQIRLQTIQFPSESVSTPNLTML